MFDYSHWNPIFTAPWCPALGEIPGDHHYVPLGEPISDDPLDILGLTIKEARELINIHGGPPFFESGYPSIDEIRGNVTDYPWFDVNLVVMMRNVWGSTRCIKQYSTNFRDKAFNRGTYVEQILYGAEVCDIKAPKVVIIASICIKEAFTQARNLVLYNETPDTTKALFLFHEAERLAAEEDFNDLEKKCICLGEEIQELAPLAADRLNTLENLNTVNQERSNASKAWHKIIGKWHDDIRKEKKGASPRNSEIALWISQRMVGEQFLLSEIEAVKDGYALNRKKDKTGQYSSLPQKSTIERILSKIRPRRK
jgi:hypothetical protein